MFRGLVYDRTLLRLHYSCAFSLCFKTLKHYHIVCFKNVFLVRQVLENDLLTFSVFKSGVSLESWHGRCSFKNLIKFC